MADWLVLRDGYVEIEVEAFRNGWHGVLTSIQTMAYSDGFLILSVPKYEMTDSLHASQAIAASENRCQTFITVK